mmetsp:Transcript_134962/g.288735  ORF Transcript_134962/g.288735 Transcript_134962/m.288735 type:complete len:299 (-) Transcript_134962:1319-2215(-)
MSLASLGEDELLVLEVPIMDAFPHVEVVTIMRRSSTDIDAEVLVRKPLDWTRGRIATSADAPDAVVERGPTVSGEDPAWQRDRGGRCDTGGCRGRCDSGEGGLGAGGRGACRSDGCGHFLVSPVWEAQFPSSAHRRHVRRPSHLSCRKFTNRASRSRESLAVYGEHIEGRLRLEVLDMEPTRLFADLDDAVLVVVVVLRVIWAHDAAVGGVVPCARTGDHLPVLIRAVIWVWSGGRRGTTLRVEQAIRRMSSSIFHFVEGGAGGESVRNSLGREGPVSSEKYSGCTRDVGARHRSAAR